MFDLQILGSSSKGNCYLLNSENDTLILEAGVRMGEVKRAINDTLNRVAGVLVSHSHTDHASQVPSMLRRGLRVFAPADVFDSIGMSGHYAAHPVEHNRGIKFGGFRVLPLGVEHDVPCMAYVVSHEEAGRILFVTDTVEFPYTVNGCNTIMMEANYDRHIIERKLMDGHIHTSMVKRIHRNHMEIGESVRTLCRMDLSNTERIVLVHLSDSNSDERRFVREVQQATGIPTTAATAGMRLYIGGAPY